MKKSDHEFRVSALISLVREGFEHSLKNIKKSPNNTFSDEDCLMSAFAMFSFKYPSMLQFDKECDEKITLQRNLRAIYKLKSVPSDTRMRERIDVIETAVLRKSFSKLFALLQRRDVLKEYKFLDDHYLISFDGTGFFSSHDVYCDHCCTKKDKKGKKSYSYQMLMAAIVHPDKKNVFPFAPEPICNTDGDNKNDCERNATKRWVDDFRREHPKLNVIALGDGLSSNAPLIRKFIENKMKFILVAKDGDHEYLFDTVKAAKKLNPEFTPLWREDAPKGVIIEYQYMNQTGLNESNDDLKINVVMYKELQKNTDGTEKILKKWAFVTNIPVTKDNIKQLVRGGRARWKIENETFNTLKNQGYHFEHNYGHGYHCLSNNLAYLLLLAFFVDQILFHKNTSMIALYETRSKRAIFEKVRTVLDIIHVDSMDDIFLIILNKKGYKVEISP